MTLTQRIHTKLLVAALAFAATFAVLAIASSRHSSAPSLAQETAFVPETSQSTDARIAALQTQVRANPKDARGYAALAQAYLQKVRETGDASFYARAGAVLASAL